MTEKCSPLRILMAAGVTKQREGGVAGVIYNLGSALSDRGNRVSCLFYDDLMTASESTGRFRDIRFAYRLAKHIARSRNEYSVVNLHAPVGFVYGLLRKLAPSGGFPPYVMTLHGLEERRVHVMKREARKGRGWDFSFKNRVWHRAYHRPRFYFAIRTADAAHCFSRDVWTILQIKYGMDPDKVAYISNGAEERFFLSREYVDRRPVRLLYAGTWLDQRGTFYLRESLLQLNTFFRDWTLTIAGGGVSSNTLYEFFGESVRSQILPVGLVPSEDMPRLYLDHDVFVFPSLMEGLPTVLLEAMATGMPVVTTDTCGMTDLVDDGVTGVLVPPANAAAVMGAVLQLCQSVDLRRNLGLAARQAMQRRRWPESARKLEAFFRTAVSDASSCIEDSVREYAVPSSADRRPSTYHE